MAEIATPPTYTIRSVADFLLVPEDRLGECLREFRIMLDMARASTALLGHVADAMAEQGELGELKAGDLRFEVVNKFVWIDDAKGEVVMTVLTAGQDENDGSACRVVLGQGAV